eukprot:CAMPEP_0198704698 /NCGR_PEP_ID=MMETSP1468-20131203/390039_1 /TAXON_ID=1461545 /ORGANISM="Mantoniella sp, Strain CCMP1436" /LENGTH=356 /DNA_ID=CAMNT_0044463523 /DNA_START=879 /DNA_END=1945 /DNA_ORIENTATION=-
MGLRPALVRAALTLLVIMACREARCAATPDAVGKGHVAVEEMLRARLFTEPHKAQQRFALPKGADGGPVNVAVGVYFYSLGQLDELAGTVAMSLWQRISWKDPNLVWNASAYGGVKWLTVNEEEIWVPDVTIYNTVGITQEEIQPTNLKVYANGLVFWSRPGPMTLKCGANGERGDRPQDVEMAAAFGGRFWPSPIDLALFPFDKQRCELVIASWVYPGSDINLTIMGPGNPFATSVAVDPPDGLDSESVEFIVHPVRVELIQRVYTCCPGEPFPTLHFYLTFERFYLDYIISILAPVVVTVSCGFLAFFIPPEFGERIGLGITCVLTVMSVMFITTTSLPSTSTITLLAMYYVGA